MKRRDWWPLAALGFLLLQTGSAVAFDGAAPALGLQSAPLQEEAWQRTPSGVQYTTLAGWTTEASGSAIFMSKPEDDARMAIVEVDARTADDAVALAWKRYRSDAQPTLRGSRARPSRNGWLLVQTYDYASAEAPGRILRAQVLHEGSAWVVVIMDLPAAVMQRREAQVTRLLSSIRAKNYVPETLVGRQARDLDPARIAALVQFVEEARISLDIPGLALGVVQRGEVKYAGGLGIRQVGSDEKVDASTRFLTASVTKPLTSLMLAKLVDMGRLDWDTPAVQVLPSFKVGDAELTKRIRVRHMLCACTGIPPQDMEWVLFGDEMTPEDVLGVLGGVAPTARTGELYQYSNLMAAAGGYLGGQVSHAGLPLGAAYDRAMQALVFDPLGMASTTFDYDVALKGNVALPHGTTIDGDTVVSSMGYNRMSIPMRPDGGAWSNINDMTRYLQMELSSGRLPDGGRYIGEAALLERQKGQVARGGVDQWYGMGLKADRRLGIQQVFHGGSMAGYQAEVYWLPENNAGYVLLMNADVGVHLRGLLADRFLEILFDIDRNAVTTLKALPATLMQERAEQRAQLRVPLDSTTLERLAPAYVHPVLGTIRIVRDGPKTWFDFDGWRTEVAMTPPSDEGQVLESISPSVAGFQFTLTQVDGARALVLNDPPNTYTFVEGDRALPRANALESSDSGQSVGGSTR
ncbi:serine hydrolase domain-containing protein [Montanilutibacter psychrotolerans]|uniref:Class A beta-lactamase-related serine hydrolase n=1 Tax=Montanilutibacter psychrotolerans TaxID=1327343 RepID=A0A3M8SV14_9GAMM|nr:serine hydrolase domain-containing protein [Lysobacter psychrotolerans]RNF83074.1 class A beta-lactamase-related serine hydrolase [Lysobacter psychrotolerans]